MTGVRLSAQQAQRTLLLLTFTRWFPVGLTIGVTTLIPLEGNDLLDSPRITREGRR